MQFQLWNLILNLLTGYSPKLNKKPVRRNINHKATYLQIQNKNETNN